MLFDELARPLATKANKPQDGKLERYSPTPGTVIELIENRDRLDELIDTFLAEDCSFLGLDTEWQERQEVALLQLAAGKRCLLLRPCCLQPAPPRLAAALRDP